MKNEKGEDDQRLRITPESFNGRTASFDLADGGSIPSSGTFFWDRPSGKDTRL